MRIHTVGLPFYSVMREKSTCAYTQKVRRFCDMMYDMGHEVILYGVGEETDARVSEFVSVGEPLGEVDFTVGAPHWVEMNERVIAAARERSERGDILGIIAGLAQRQIADTLDHLAPVEWGIGYAGTFSQFRVFESYAWMHTVYGAQSGGDAFNTRGNAYEVVIPNSFEAADFPFREDNDGYLLFVGRLIQQKGTDVVREIAARTKIPVLVAGQPMEMDDIPGTQYLGVLGEKERNEAMAGAIALLAPTQYVEPFGGVAVEAMMCGTPVISTDWGAFTETVMDGVSGFRCWDLKDYLNATEMAKDMDRNRVRQWAMRYDTETIKYKYDTYLHGVQSVFSGAGWYEGAPDVLG